VGRASGGERWEEIGQPVLGDVVVEARKVEGKARPEIVARFTINAIPAMALLARGQAAKSDDPTVTMWEMEEDTTLPGSLPGQYR